MRGVLCVPRSAFIEPLGTRREEFYEQRLLESLPWYVASRPEVMQNGTQRWVFKCDLPWGAQQEFSMTDREVQDSNGMPTTFEEMCQKIEAHFHSHACLCCADTQTLKHVVKKGEEGLYSLVYGRCAPDEGHEGASLTAGVASQQLTDHVFNNMEVTFLPTLLQPGDPDLFQQMLNSNR